MNPLPNGFGSSFLYIPKEGPNPLQAIHHTPESIDTLMTNLVSETEHNIIEANAEYAENHAQYTAEVEFGRSSDSNGAQGAGQPSNDAINQVLSQILNELGESLFNDAE